MTRLPDNNRLAAWYVAKHGPGDLADRRELLDALGLIDSTGRGIVPTLAPGKQASMGELSAPATAYSNGERDSGMWQDDKVRPRDLSAVPQGLREYDPGPSSQPSHPARRRGRVRAAA